MVFNKEFMTVKSVDYRPEFVSCNGYLIDFFNFQYKFSDY